MSDAEQPCPGLGRHVGDRYERERPWGLGVCDLEEGEVAAGVEGDAEGRDGEARGEEEPVGLGGGEGGEVRGDAVRAGEEEAGGGEAGAGAGFGLGEEEGGG